MNTQSDPKARTSFFDSDDLQVHFSFKKFEKFHQKNIGDTPLIQGMLMKHNMSQGTQTEPTLFALHNQCLIKYQKDSTSVIESILDISHSRLRELIPTGTNSNYGFSLAKNGAAYEFYSPEKQEIEKWYGVLKKICVLSQFHNEYKAIKLIGKGSFAKVYLVESKASGKEYAVKSFVKESFISSNKSCAKPSMLNEIDIMRALKHDNIIKLYEVYETEKSIYLVIELIQGKPLQDILQRPNFKEVYTEARLIKMIYSILDALAYLASKGIMHRDLKPDNILVDKEDRVKIADFGLATYIDIPEYIFKKCGTPGYIAPEVLKYDQRIPRTFYDHHCDVFSAGCILFYMLFGRPFFDGNNASEILLLNRKYNSVDSRGINIAKIELSSANSKISKEGINLMLQLLEFDNKKRISSSKAISHTYFSSIHSDSEISLDDFSADSTPRKRGSFMAEHVLTSRRESLGCPSPVNMNRFTERDSLYLDMGKPDLNGRVDTLAAGSHNNSMLFPRRSSASDGSKEGSMQSFAKSPLLDPKRRTSQRNYLAGNSQSVLKAAIFRNIQKNMEGTGEEGKDDIRDDDTRNKRRVSDFSKKTSNSSVESDIDIASDICQEDNQLELYVLKLNAESPLMVPGMKTRFMAQLASNK